jgi:nicotinamide mononucleotide adenylyltransferase
MNITIIPGSYKPPHKGHLSLIEKLIKNNNNSKIILIISKKPRSLDKNFLYMEGIPKNILHNTLITYFPNEIDEILKLSKVNTIKKINELINNKLLKSVNSEKSYKVWKIYLKYLKQKYNTEKYKKINFPKIIFRVSENNNIILETDKVIREIFYKKEKGNILLMKSVKNKNNSRFNFLEKRYKKYIKTILFPNIKDIDATGMRQSILNNNIEEFFNYLPKDLEEKYKNKIWKIVK